MAAIDEPTAQAGAVSPIPFLSTGVKMFLILSLALLPLGIVALFASLQSIRTADVERESLLRMAVTQSARKLASELASDQTALRLTVETLARGKDADGICGRAAAFLRARDSTSANFAIYARSGQKLCASPGAPQDAIPASQRFQDMPALLLPDRAMLLMRTTSANGQLVALTSYTRDDLDRITDPTTALANRQVILRQGSRSLDIGSFPAAQRNWAVNQESMAVGATGITLTVLVRAPPQTLARSLSLFLPLVMWFAAAAIGWLVVNRLLIRPLVLLQRAVAAYQPGTVLAPLEKLRTPAQEISHLNDTFRAISEDVATHEAELAEGLERQRKLTREVHHRVKNNLQIIASLINLHSRSATTPEAVDAYGSIQRRVDALSVVHRNHYAELEESRGVGIRALISELSASLRATAPDPSSRMAIQIECGDFHVSQDIAVPVAFLVTELVEMAMLSDPAARITITVHPIEDEPGRGQLNVSSPALRPSLAMMARLEGRFERVLTGLSRQLRAPLRRDEDEGMFCIDITIVD